MEDADQYSQFLAEYDAYVRNVLQPTQNEVRALLDRWTESTYWSHYARDRRLPLPSPVRMVENRIKRPESVVDKILRKPRDYPKGLHCDSIRCMDDTLGLRVIVYFLSQLPLVDGELRKLAHLEISRDNPPVAYMPDDLLRLLSLTHLKPQKKESGYASLHYVARLRESSIAKCDRPWFEVQVRTLTEDLWAEIEHFLAYKPNKRMSHVVSRQFEILSLELAAIDQHFDMLYEGLSRFQGEGTFTDADPLNAENLPAVLAEAELGCSQRQLSSILKLLFSRGITTVGEFRHAATRRHLGMIRNTYRAERGENPDDLQVIATLAVLHGAKDEMQEINLVKAQIAYTKAWDALEKDLDIPATIPPA